MITPYNLLRHELCGLDARVIKSRDPDLRAQGTITGETRDTLTLKTPNGEKKIIKKDVELEIRLPKDAVVHVDGRLLSGRPADRIKKKIRIRH